MLVAEEEHDGARVVQLVHGFEVGHFVEVAQVDGAEVLDAVRDLVENFVLRHAVRVRVAAKADEHETVFFAEDRLVDVPACAEVREDDAPLVLWDCIFPHAEEVQSSEERQHGYEDRLNWVYIGDEGGMDPKARGLSKNGTGPSSMGRGKWGRGGVVDDVWEVWRGNKIDETLAALLLDKIAGLGSSTLDAEGAVEEQTVGIARGGPRVFDGGDLGRAKGNYTRLLERERQESVEVVNERYRVRKGIEAGGVREKEEDGDE